MARRKNVEHVEDTMENAGMQESEALNAGRIEEAQADGSEECAGDALDLEIVDGDFEDSADGDAGDADEEEEDMESIRAEISGALATLSQDGKSGPLRRMEAVKAFFEENGYSYTMRKDTLLRGGFKIRGKLGRVEILVDTDCRRVVKLMGICGICAAEETRAAVCEYLTRANYGLIEGCFEFDMRDGEVRYRMTVSERDGAISSDALDHALDIIIAMFAQYGDGLGALMMGYSDPETEIEKAEGD